jgi:hypothetical protein
MAIYGDGKHNENMEHIAKEYFAFHVDKKVTVWVRETHHIQAENYEAARMEMMEAFHDNLCSETFTEQEYLSDTEDIMEPGDNGGEATIELISDAEPGALTTNIDQCFGCDWVATVDISAPNQMGEICTKCGLKNRIIII